MKNNLKIIEQSRPDDEDLTRDVKGMTIAKFIKEGRQNLTDVHKLVLNAIAFILGHITIYFIFYHGR